MASRSRGRYYAIYKNMYGTKMLHWPVFRNLISKVYFLEEKNDLKPRVGSRKKNETPRKNYKYKKDRK